MAFMDQFRRKPDAGWGDEHPHVEVVDSDTGSIEITYPGAHVDVTGAGDIQVLDAVHGIISDQASYEGPYLDTGDVDPDRIDDVIGILARQTDTAKIRVQEIAKDAQGVSEELSLFSQSELEIRTWVSENFGFVHPTEQEKIIARVMELTSFFSDISNRAVTTAFSATSALSHEINAHSDTKEALGMSLRLSNSATQARREAETIATGAVRGRQDAEQSLNTLAKASYRINVRNFGLQMGLMGEELEKFTSLLNGFIEQQKREADETITGLRGQVEELKREIQETKNTAADDAKIHYDQSLEGIRDDVETWKQEAATQFSQRLDQANAAIAAEKARADNGIAAEKARADADIALANERAIEWKVYADDREEARQAAEDEKAKALQQQRKDEATIINLKTTIENLAAVVEDHERTISDQSEEITGLNGDIASMKAEHKAEIEGIQGDAQREIDSLKRIVEAEKASRIRLARLAAKYRELANIAGATGHIRKVFENAPTLMIRPTQNQAIALVEGVQNIALEDIADSGVTDEDFGPLQTGIRQAVVEQPSPQPQHRTFVTRSVNQ